ncbi:MAG: OmpA family protein, partial [Pseudomonadales bacterium]|nr:OmpA family protein [Pseudomonadales bacterium]
IALGERRGKAVEKFLLVNGVSASQIETVSYGEERPVEGGHDEGSWAKNRRVEIVYK